LDTILNVLSQFWLNFQHGQLPVLGGWNYLLLMVLIVVQGPIATMLGGAAAAAGLLNPFGVLGVAVVGNLGADAFWFTMGRASKIGALGRWSRRSQLLVRVLREVMHEHALKVLLMAKLSIGLAVPAIIAAGLARLPWRRWFPIVFTGEILWTGMLLLVGYFATEVIKGAEQVGVYLGAVASALLIGGIMVAIPRKLNRYYIETSETRVEVF
jgi:membrane protein DedA with SNARE-associated domain